MRRAAILLACLLPFAAAAETCPPPPANIEARARLMAEIRIAPDEAAARLLSGQLWRLWATAPDARAQAMLDRGMARRGAYDFEAAKAAFDDLVAYCPDYAEGWNQRAFVAFLRGDFGNALEDLEVALSLAPDHIAAKAGLALTLMQLGRTQAGQAVLKEALAMNPWLPERSLLIPEPEAPGEDL